MPTKTAVILAGGLGTRLRSSVSDVPKSLAPIHHEPFLFLLFRALAQNSIEKVIMLTGYRHEQVVAACGDGSAFGLEFIYSCEATPLGTAGALKNAEAYLKDTPNFLLLNGDSFCAEAISVLSRYPDLNTQQFGVMAVAPIEDTSRFGTVVFDPITQTILSFQEKSAHQSGYVNAGVYLLSDKIFPKIPAEQKCSLEQEIFPECVSQLSVCVVQSGFDDIGLPESYQDFLTKTKAIENA